MSTHQLVAQDVLTGLPVLAAGYRGQEVVCGACQGAVYHRRDHEKQGRRVRAHFVHRGHNCGGGEGAAHRLAKELLCRLVVERRVAFRPPACRVCGEAEEMVFEGTGARCEGVVGPFRADVVTDAGEAVEVVDTHPCPEDKLEYYARHLRCFVEVRAHAVLALLAGFQGGQGGVDVVVVPADRCSGRGPMCAGCAGVADFAAGVRAACAGVVGELVATAECERLAREACVAMEAHDATAAWLSDRDDDDKGTGDKALSRLRRARDAIAADAALVEEVLGLLLQREKLEAKVGRVPADLAAERERLMGEVARLEEIDRLWRTVRWQEAGIRAVLGTGKYAGWNVGVVWDTDPNYVRWVAGYTGRLDEKGRPARHERPPKNFGAVVEADAARLVARRCVVCFGPRPPEPWRAACPACFRAR